MAKRRSRWPEEDDSEDEDVIEVTPEPRGKSRADAEGLDEDATGEEPAAKKTSGRTDPKSRDFFQTIGDGLKSAGKAAEKYAKMGISAAALEKQRLDLRLAYAKLGEAVHRCWNDAPDLGVAATDASVKAHVKAINDLRRKIRETEIKLRELRKG